MNSHINGQNNEFDIDKIIDALPNPNNFDNDKINNPNKKWYCYEENDRLRNIKIN